MAKTEIEWSQHVWNPLAGCSVLTPGCTNCYAQKMAARLERMGQPLYAGLTKPTKGGAVWTGEMRRASEEILLAPLRRKTPTIYFVNSMSDLFHENVPDEWIDAIFCVMALTPRHTYQILTKRAARMRDYVSRMDCELSPSDRMVRALGVPREHLVTTDWPLPNVWKGVSTEDQKRADERIPELLLTPAAVRFISAEPLLGEIDLDEVKFTFMPGYFGGALGSHHIPYADRQTRYPRLDWVIAGGESGHRFRHMDPIWMRSLRDQCAVAGVPFFAKQMSGRLPIPEDLRVRQFPETRAAGKAA